MVVKYIPLYIRKSQLRKQVRHLERARTRVLDSSLAGSTESAARIERRAALDAAFGIWKGRTDIPTDGLEYQLAMRAE